MAVLSKAKSQYNLREFAMLCLFRNSRLSPFYHLLASAISLGSVLYWFYFSLIQKSFLENVFSGQALMVDLLFGLPIVLIFAIVIYAFLYWSVKFLVILLLPHTIIHIASELEEEDELPETLDLSAPATKKTQE